MAKDSKLLTIAHSSQNYNYQRREARMTHYECCCSILFLGANFKSGWPTAPSLWGGIASPNKPSTKLHLWFSEYFCFNWWHLYVPQHITSGVVSLYINVWTLLQNLYKMFLSSLFRVQIKYYTENTTWIYENMNVELV